MVKDKIYICISNLFSKIISLRIIFQSTITRNICKSLFFVFICQFLFLQVEKEGRDDADTPDPPKPLLCTLCPHICSSPTALGEHVLQAHRSLSSPLCESPRPPSRKSCSKCTEELASPNAVCPHRKVCFLINSLFCIAFSCSNRHIAIYL